jgi:NAD(P)H-flavin reductase
MKGDVIMVAGGIGIPPIKSLMLYLLKNKRKYGKIGLYYGAKTPEERVYKRELNEWGKEVEVKVTVDKGNKDWKGNVGVVTNLLEKLRPGKKAIACMCGPPIMSKFVSQKLVERGMKWDQIYVSMERMMQCGLGMCGHCNIGKVYVCKHGPVFRLDELKKNTEKFW